MAGLPKNARRILGRKPDDERFAMRIGNKARGRAGPFFYVFAQGIVHRLLRVVASLAVVGGQLGGV